MQPQPVGTARELPLEALKTALGEDGVSTDSKDLAYFSHDVYRAGTTVGAVLRPASVDALANAVRIAADAGLAIHVRGGGYSYTDAYLAEDEYSVCIDTTALNRVVEVNTQDRYVTVESGCTWEALDRALSETGYRTSFWGPLSGHNATIGGAISQGALSLGSSKYGASGESVLGVRVVAADGSIFDSGSAAQEPHSAFFRGYGPDLTGLFCGDAGALGVKAEITLRLVRRREKVHGLSFGSVDFQSFTATMSAIAASGEATEAFGFSAVSLASSTASSGLKEDLQMLWQIGKSSASAWDGLKQMASTALAGRRFLDRVPWTSHCVLEADNALQLKGQIRGLRAAIGDAARALPNTVPTVIRAAPFIAYDALSPEARRMLPMHTILPFSRVPEFHAKYDAVIQAHQTEMDACGVNQSTMFATVGVNGFLYEPVLLWEDEMSPFHERHAHDGSRELAKEFSANPAARDLVDRLKAAIRDAMFESGGTHTQIGKMYPFMRDRQPMTAELIADVKRRIDPNHRINPGALGLRPPQN